MTKKKLPGTRYKQGNVNSKRSNRIVFIALFIIVTAILLYRQDGFRITPLLPLDGEIVVHFIDVGQGHSVLVQSNENAVLIDGGPPAALSVLVQYLEAAGVTTIDYVIATHPHADHIGGLAGVLDRFYVQNVWMPDVLHDTAAFERFLDAIERNGLAEHTYFIQAGDYLQAGIIQMTAVAPNSSGHRNLNNYSIVLRMQYGQRSFLFTGDIESIAEHEIVNIGWLIQADVLQIPHHGSQTSSTAVFLDTVRPNWAVIQSMAGNQFGHPHQSVLDRLNARGIRILRTDEMGTIVIATNGADVWLVSGY